MDVPRFPPTIFDLLGHRFSQPQGPGKNGRTQKQSKDGRRPDPSFRDLVKADELYFRVVSDPRQPQTVPAVKGTTTTVTVSVEQAFSQAFNSVWSRLPLLDRQRLLGYWKGEIGYVPPDSGFPPPEHRPVIQVFLDDTKVRLGSDWSGTQLNFAAAQVLNERSGFPRVIARTLAEVYRCTTGRRSGLTMERIVGPLEMWEQEREGTFTDEEYEEIQDALEADFCRAYEMEVMEILRRWKFEEPQSDQEPRRV